MPKISNTFLFIIIVLNIMLSAGYMAYDMRRPEIIERTTVHAEPEIIERTTVHVESEGRQTNGIYIPGYGVSSTLAKRFIFAVPSETCPPGSAPSTVPANHKAREEGYIYCYLHKTTITLDTKNFPQCPNGYKEYTHQTYKPEDGFIWCELASLTAENEMQETQ